MQTTKLLLAFLCANGAVARAEEPQPTPKKLFEYHFATLQGARLQPSGGLQPAAGVQASAGDRGAAAPVTRPTSEEEWRRMFPKKLGAK